MIALAAVVIFWDGNNCDLAINYIMALRGQNCRVLKQLNEYRGEPLQVELVRSVDPETEAARLRDYSPVVKKLDEKFGGTGNFDGRRCQSSRRAGRFSAPV